MKAKIDAFFEPSGLLSEAISGYQSREEQRLLALHVLDALQHKKHLVSEAGTGVGKTFAYLVPAILSGQKIVISTATKTLQDQLVQKDLPFLIRTLGLSVSVQNLKGRGNYLCRERIRHYQTEGTFESAESAHDLAFVNRTLPRLQEGVRAELPEIAEDSLVWPYVTSTRENCLGAECEFYQTCFLIKARKKALKARITVINHHLFFADMREGSSEVLKDVDAFIFDEAHHLPSIAEGAFDVSFGTRECLDCLDALIQQLLPQESVQFISFRDALFFLFNELHDILRRFPDKVAFHDISSDQKWIKGFDAVLEKLKEIEALFPHIVPEEDEGSALLLLMERFQTITRTASHFLTSSEGIPWISRFKQALVFHRTPFDISEDFLKILSGGGTYIFTSATLAIADSFQSFIGKLSLENPETVCLKSPFRYETQALLYMPRDLPDAKHPSYYPRMVEKILPILNACQGRAFVLFTSRKAILEVCALLKGVLNYPLLVQGEEASSILLQRFRALGNAVLLGTATFWEGVDVKGEALSCVVIDKLPFASPVDPVMRGKMAWYRKEGRSDFDELSLPEAILTLRQGVGRLIRDANDKGVLVIADPRLWTRSYGEMIFKSLPPFQKTRDEARVLQFIDEFELNEIISN